MSLQSDFPSRINRSTGELINLAGTNLPLTYSIYRQLESLKTNIAEGNFSAALTSSAQDFHAVRDYSFGHPERVLKLAHLIRTIAFVDQPIGGHSPLHGEIRRSMELVKRPVDDLKNHSVLLLAALTNYEASLSLRDPHHDAETFHLAKVLYSACTRRDDPSVFKELGYEAILRAGVALHNSNHSQISPADRNYFVERAYGELEAHFPSLSHLLFGAHQCFAGNFEEALDHAKTALQFAGTQRAEKLPALELQSRALFRLGEYEQAESCCIDLGRMVTEQPLRYDQMRRRNNLLLASLYQIRGISAITQKLLSPENLPQYHGNAHQPGREFFFDIPPL